MPKQYFFEAGSFSDISFAELVSICRLFGIHKENIQRFSDKVFIIRDKDLSPDILERIFNRLGGFVRYGYILNGLDAFLDEYISKGTKVVFGVSVLGVANNQDSQFLKNLSSEIKEELKDKSVSSRYIKPIRNGLQLNAAQVTKNQVIKKGFELCIIRNEKEEVYGCTLGVQDIEGFASRDFEKPYTDVKMGTLPPKLARMMVNLASLKDGIIWDPFCGSGTILMEAGVLGFDILGSDIEEDAVNNTQKNIQWLSQNGFVGNIKYELFQNDIKDTSPRVLSKLKHTGISAVVCEPFMGPPQHVVMFPNRAEVYLKRVKEIYVSLFSVLEKFVHEGFVAVVIIPSYRTHKGWSTFSVREIVGKRWDVLNSEVSGGRDLKWSRKNSIITRNIFILRKR